MIAHRSLIDASPTETGSAVWATEPNCVSARVDGFSFRPESAVEYFLIIDRLPTALIHIDQPSSAKHHCELAVLAGTSGSEFILLLGQIICPSSLTSFASSYSSSSSSNSPTFSNSIPSLLSLANYRRRLTNRLGSRTIYLGFHPAAFIVSAEGELSRRALSSAPRQAPSSCQSIETPFVREQQQGEEA